jgi:NAD(P)-dependent dehydrogenase (short-subunit alcohol dehydrogenase family)
MTERLDGKVVVITGGASGIGRETALRFLDEGARVVIADVNEAGAADTIRNADQRGTGGRIHFVQADVSVETDVRSAIETAVERFGRLDCIFNNAGLPGAIGPITDVAVEDWDYTLAVLLTGVMLGIKHGARVLKDQGEGGTIINTSSTAGVSGGAGPPAYSAAKAAVLNLTQTTAVELAEHRIRVNALIPGGILTPLAHRGQEDATGRFFDKMQPWPTHGTAAHLAGAALFLASDDSEFVTGQAIAVDGGLLAAGPMLISRFGIGDFSGRSGVDSGTTGRPATFQPVSP